MENHLHLIIDYEEGNKASGFRVLTVVQFFQISLTSGEYGAEAVPWLSNKT